MSLFNIKKSKGVHPPENKTTYNKVIEKAPLPKEVTLPMCQHLGAPAKLIVEKGDTVKTGQIIGEPGGFISANIHATVSGNVKKIVKLVNVITSQPMDAVVIESDEKDKWVTTKKIKNWETTSNEKLADQIKNAGIVGLGGATFPTNVKLSPPPGKNIDTIILNGCECEPFITSDHRLMLEYGDQIIKGLQVMMKMLSCDNVHIAIESNKPDAIELMNDLVNKKDLKNVKVSVLKSKYPMGAEKTLTKNLLGREVPIGGLPLDVGVVVQNVSTVNAIYDAIFEGKPLVERVVTVDGLVKEPKNLIARFGTPTKDLIEYCGGVSKDANEIIFGGPMMGLSQLDLDTPTNKGTNCILIKKAEVEDEKDCIRCSNCINSCPMDLMPTMYVQLVKKKKYEECGGEFFVDNCVECGACAYSCPAKIPIVQYIKIAKNELRKVRAKK
jgi:electron transport complex protein RnfC